MGEKYPVFGAGFGSYNQFAYDNGLRVGGDRWNFNGHNCYFQIAVELGIVGSIFFFCLQCFPLYSQFSQSEG